MAVPSYEKSSFFQIEGVVLPSYCYALAIQSSKGPSETLSTTYNFFCNMTNRHEKCTAYVWVQTCAGFDSQKFREK